MPARLTAILVAIMIGGGLVVAPAAGPAPAARAASDGFAYGVVVDTTDARSMRMAREAGFTHAKMMLRWEAVEPSPGNLVWKQTQENDFDNIMKPARNEGMLMIVRVDGVPGWAGGSPANASLEAVRGFYEEAARHGKGTVVGYEILNEPNLDREWGGPPSAGAYTAFLRAAYQGIKAGDPDALVIGGGPAPGTGNHPGATIEDVDFLNGMYDAGAAGVMDALSVHNYGGNTPPEMDPSECGICFRRAELYREVMVRRGDGGKPVWLTEWGYLVDAGQDMGQYDWMKVSADAQADYLVRAFRYAFTHWPWLAGSLLYNIDGAASPYQNYGGFDAKAWFSILNHDYSPRPAYGALQSMGTELARTHQPDKPTEQAAPEEPVAQPAPTEPAAQAEPAQAPANASTDGARLRVTGTDGEGLVMRARPSREAEVLKLVADGSILVGTGETRQNEGRRWLQVRAQDGQRGWVAADYVMPA